MVNRRVSLVSCCSVLSLVSHAARITGIFAVAATALTAPGEALAQAGGNQTFLCQPAIDPRCSPKIVRGPSVVRTGFTNLAIKSPSYVFNAPGNLILNSAIVAGGFCGRTGQPACPEKRYESGVAFKADTASVVINARGTSLGLSSDPGQACGMLYIDILKKEGNTETLVSSELLGQSCDSLPQAHTFSFTAAGLEVGKDYVAKGRLYCLYGAIQPNGSFICTSGPVNMQVVSPFGTYTAP